MIEDVIKPDYLSNRYFIFCETYIKTNNAAESARQAGYSKKTAGIQGCSLLKHPKIKRYLQERAQAVNEYHGELIASADEIMEYLTRVMRGEEKYYNFRGEETPMPIIERTKAAQELAKRLVDNQGTNLTTPVQFIIDIPKSDKKENDDVSEETDNNTGTDNNTVI